MSLVARCNIAIDHALQPALSQLLVTAVVHRVAYQAVAHERDLLRSRLDFVEPELDRFRGVELMALVCDQRCGHCIVGATESIILQHANTLGWCVDAETKFAVCTECCSDKPAG